MYKTFSYKFMYSLELTIKHLFELIHCNKNDSNNESVIVKIKRVVEMEERSSSLIR